MNQVIGEVNAIPSKGIYRSIIADYDLITAICELVDNALDARKVTSCSAELTVKISIDPNEGRIIIEDNACGVKQDELTKLVSPGETSSSGIDGVIGIFGVGSKRAVVALAQEIKIITRFNSEKTFCIEYDDAWLESDEWKLPYYEVENIEENTTIIILSKLRIAPEDINLKDLEIELEYIYAYFINDEDIKIFLNGVQIGFRFFDQWAYPPLYEPIKYIQTLHNENYSANMTLNLTAGLTYEKGSLSGDYGVFIYCNKRLIARASKTPEVGFETKAHAASSSARIIVELNGPPELMPWQSNKRGISYNHDTFRLIRDNLTEITKNITALSRALKQDAEKAIEPFKIGNIKIKKLGMTEIIKPSKLPLIPKKHTNYKDNILSLNKSLGAIKPWTKSLYESVIAEELISRQSLLSQKNKISLVILDSIIEVGCEEYLIRNNFSSKDSFNKIGRLILFSEVEKHIMPGNSIWDRLQKVYHRRRTLSSQILDSQIFENEINQFREDVKTFLSEAFEIKFPD